MKWSVSLLCRAAFLAATLHIAVAADLSVKDSADNPADFSLVVDGRAATVVVDQGDAEVVRIAAGLLAQDVQRVTGVKPDVTHVRPHKTDTPIVLVGTLGQSALIDDLAKRASSRARPSPASGNRTLSQR